MRLCIVTAFPRDLDAPKGGVEAVSVVLVRALSKLPGLAIDVVTCDAVTSAEITTIEGFTVHRLPRLGKSMLSGAIGADRKQVSAYVMRLKPDMVHAHDTYGLMTADLPLPRVFTVHGFIYGDTLLAAQRFAWLRSKVWERVEKSSWSRQPYIVSISPYVRERLQEIATGTIHDIDNPIAPVFFETAYRPVADRIFCAAVINPRKNTLALVQAFATIAAEFPSAELRLAGAIGHPAYGEKIKQEITKPGLGSRVKLLGKIPTAAVREEIQSAAIFALVSLEENSPLGIEEAMAVGVPVVTSNRCGMPYMVEDGKSGFLVDPTDIRDIADRLRTVLKDTSLARSMSDRARQIARERFHPDVVAARTLAVYEEALRATAQKATGAIA